MIFTQYTRCWTALSELIFREVWSKINLVNCVLFWGNNEELYGLPIRLDKYLKDNPSQRWTNDLCYGKIILGAMKIGSYWIRPEDA